MQRRDGLETRDNLLAAAAAVFSEKGYSDAPVAEICERAEANIAAVNYHFGGKEALYVEVWTHLVEEVERLFPHASEEAADVSLEGRLEAHLATMLKRMTHRGRPGCMYRMLEHERSNPTGLVDDVIRKIREPSRQVLHALIEEGLGNDAPEEMVRFTAYSIINQCRGAMANNTEMVQAVLGQKLTSQVLDRLAAHIARFSVGGMERTRQVSKTGESDDC